MVMCGPTDQTGACAATNTPDLVRHLSGAPYGAGGLRLRGGQTTAFRSAEVRDEMFCACVSLREERETHTQLAFFRPDLRR